MYYVLSRNKKTQYKLNHNLLIEKLTQMFPNSIVEKHENRFNGTYIVCQLEHEKIYIKLNKSSPEFRPRKIHENIPKNSYVFYMSNNILNNKIIEEFDLTYLEDSN